jgi:hypothetical protein
MYDPLQCAIAGHTQDNCSSKQLTYYHWRKKIVSGLELKDFTAPPTAPPQTPLRCTSCIMIAAIELQQEWAVITKLWSHKT